MHAPCIRMDYDEGRVCEACFSETAEGIQSLRSSLARCLNLLQEGAWTGQGAGAFYAEMNSEVLPAVDRLGQALQEACRAMATIGAHFQAAEREAGALFVGAEDYDDKQFKDSESHRKAIPASYSGSDGQDNPEQGDEEEPTTAKERSDIYRSWSDKLEAADSTRSDIEFYNAAARVTALLGIADDQAGLLNIIDGNMEIFAGVPALTSFIGEGLFRLNRSLFELLRDGKLELLDGRLVSPMNDPSIFELLTQGYTVDANGQLLSPEGNSTGRSVNLVNTPLDWDIAMVFREQLAVHDLLYEYSARSNPQMHSRTLYGVNALLNVGDDSVTRAIAQGLLGASSENFQAIDWAESALRSANVIGAHGNITFGNYDHRVAIGLAMIFQQHADSFGGTAQAQAAYMAYIQNIVSMTNATTPWGTNILYSGGPIPSIQSLPGSGYNYTPRRP